MRWPLSQNNKAQEEVIDEHNQPTEPIARLVLPAYTPPANQPNPPFDEPTISTLPVQPLPQAPIIQQQAPVLPGAAQPQQPQYLQQPVQPIQAYNPNNPPVAASPYADVPALPVVPALPAQPQGVAVPQKGHEKQARPRQPIYVGLFFVVVQFLLLARFGIGLLSLPADNVWRDIIYTFSDVFLLPFTLLFRQVTLPIPIGSELYPLIAVLVYGIISRILVRLLKTVLRTQQARKA